MSDVTSVFQAPEFHVIDGKSVEFPLLEMQDVASICAKMRAERVASARRLAESCRLTPPEIMRELASIDAKPITIFDFASFVDTPAGADQVLVQSLAKRGVTGEEAAKSLKPMPAFERVKLAQLVSTVAVRQPAE